MTFVSLLWVDLNCNEYSLYISIQMNDSLGKIKAVSTIDHFPENKINFWNFNHMEFSAVIENAKLGTCSSNVRPQDCLQINLFSVPTDLCQYMGNNPPQAMLPLTLPHNFS